MGFAVNPLVLSCAIFLLVLGGIFFGALFRCVLPGHHLSRETQDVVRLGAGLIATIAALVLGLLIASAKGSFDTRSGQIKHYSA
jgi:Trk-type K+ transport system membrane component